VREVATASGQAAACAAPTGRWQETQRGVPRSVQMFVFWIGCGNMDSSVQLQC
jgi:hypothetical protein